MDPFLGEIKIFAGSFAPRGYAFCDGQLLPISQNTALFSLLGTTYGGDGRTTFALPNLKGRAPMKFGQGPGLSSRPLGQNGGEETVTLLSSEMPIHPHVLRASSDPGDLNAPSPLRSLARSSGGFAYQSTISGLVTMQPQALSLTGGNGPHNNMQPFLALVFIIALQGIYPSRS